MLSPKNYHVLFGKSTLGVFYKVIGRIKDAHPLFQDVVDSLGLQNYQHYIKSKLIILYLESDYDKMIPWIPTVFEYLVDCYRIMQLNDKANHYQNTLDNLRENTDKKNKNDFTIEMEKEPPSDLHHFFVSSFLQR